MRKLHHIAVLTRLHWSGSPLDLLRRLTWEAPQIFLGYWTALGMILLYRSHRPHLELGVIVLQIDTGKPFWGGICFGHVILGDRRIKQPDKRPLFMHEFGHVLQSRASGPLYLFKYGLPSLFSARRRGRHAFHPVEQDANCRARAFFAEHTTYGDWLNDINPILDHSKPLRIHWWEYLPGIFPLLHLFYALTPPPDPSPHK